mmetsp:Transcript_113806/g.226496  ORF Transcript_113806/g.226496 Transcript_113806/m.226496 type:complete len:317 (-) Transcript_113806:146-1096(-)
MSEGLARRLGPIGNTFINVPECRTATAKRRTQSFPGYITQHHRGGDVPLPGDLIVDGDMHYVRLDGSYHLVETTGTKNVSSSDGISQQCTLPRNAACCRSDVSTTNETEGCQSSCEETLTEPGTPTLHRTVEEEFTTLMIRNLPHDLTQMHLIAELDKNGFEQAYDFLYMPSNFCSGRGKGYAFINFTQQAAARQFVAEWHKGVRFGAGRDRGGLSISAAAVQGREANVKKWDVPRMRRIKNPNFRPLVAVKPTSGGPCVLVPSCSMDSEAALIAEGPQLGGVARRQFPGQANHWTRHGQAASGRTGGRAGQAPVQ